MPSQDKDQQQRDMKLTTVQKISLVFFVCTLLPAYWIANWRHTSNEVRLNEAFEREQTLHLSTDKLLDNCEKIASSQSNPYDANHQICNQGLQVHQETSDAMEVLTGEEAYNDMKWYRNFFVAVLVLNLLGWVIYRANIYLKRESD